MLSSCKFRMKNVLSPADEGRFMFRPLVLFVPQEALTGLNETADAHPVAIARTAASPRSPKDS